MTTQKQVLDLIYDSRNALSAADIVRLLPGFSKKSIQSALTRLVAANLVKWRFSHRCIHPNNRGYRIYWAEKS